MEEEKKNKKPKRKMVWISLLLLLLVTGLIVVFVLFFISNSKTYKVDFVSNCDTEVLSQEVKNGSLLEEPDVSKDGYTLHGWYNDSKEWNFESDKVNSNMTLNARWDINYYEINIDYDGGTATNPTKYTIEDKVDLSPATKTGYTFVGYFDNDGNEVESIEKGTTGDINIKARYTINTYMLTITHQEKWGTFTGAGEYAYGSDVTLSVTLNPTYEMIYWIDKDSHNILSDKTSFTLKMPAKNLDVTITIVKDNFEITYVDEKNANNPNPTSWQTHDPLTLEDLECDDDDYVFAGWYDEDENLVTTLELDVAKNVTLTAKWSFKPVTLTLSSRDKDLIVSGGGTYDTGSTVTLSIDDSGLDYNYAFAGWYDVDDNFVSGDRDYSFTITEDLELYATTRNCTYSIVEISENHRKETYYDSGKTGSYINDFYYNESGKLIRKSYESLTSTLNTESVYEYDEKDNLISQEDKRNGQDDGYKLYYYDELNRLVKIENKPSKTKAPTSTYNYTYEADGESYSVEYVPSSGSSYISETHTISYKDGLRYDKITIYHEGFYYIEVTDEAGRQISRTGYDTKTDKEEFCSANVYWNTYDDNGLLVHTYGYSAESYNTDYFYNENNQEIKNVRIIDKWYSGWHYYTSTFYDSSSRISRVEKFSCIPPETGHSFSSYASKTIYVYDD